MAKKYLRHDDLIIPQGTSYAVFWPLLDEVGGPFDPTGWKARCQARSSVGSTSVLHEWTTENDGLAFDGPKITLIIEPATSTAWKWASASYDIELYNNGIVARLTQGTMTIDREVTR